MIDPSVSSKPSESGRHAAAGASPKGAGPPVAPNALTSPDGEDAAFEAPIQLPNWLVWLPGGLTALLSERGLTLTLGAILFVFLSLVLGLDALDLVHVVHHGVSTKTITAPYPMVVVDDVKTQAAMDLARQRVQPIYKPQSPIDTDVRKGVASFFGDLEALRHDASLSATERREHFQALSGDDPSARVFYDRFFKILTPDKLLQYRTATQVSVDRILRQGLAPKAYFENLEPIVARNLASRGLTQPERELVAWFVSLVIKPNRVLDEPAMVSAWARAEADVDPVVTTFNKGDVIVSKGDEVTPLQVQALEKMGKTVKGANWMAFLAIAGLVMVYLSFIWLYMRSFNQGQVYSPAHAGLLATLTLGVGLGVKLFTQNDWPMLAFPLAAYGLMVSVFFHPRFAILTTVFTVLLVTLALRMDVQVMTILMVGTLIGIWIIHRRRSYSDRNQLVMAGLWIGLTHAVLIVLLGLLNHNSSAVGIDWRALITDMGFGLFLGGLLSSILTLGILPLLESAFQLVTPFTLKDLDNHDHPLLKRMQLEAPGTFHHSLLIAALSEAAAEAIGANALLARVGCLYHDIGKMKRPLFFVENQAYYGVDNPHDKLTPRLSKLVITAHPKDSLEMARHYRLPHVIQKFMTEHHGTLVAGYFYNKACQLEGADNVVKSQFRYPGPKPDIKETGIVMLADASESSVRALKNPAVEDIEARIDKIFRERLDDGQFDNCPLTLKDIAVVKATFVRVLRGIRHNRIEYQQTVLDELHKKLPLPEPVAALPLPANGAGLLSAAELAQQIQDQTADLVEQLKDEASVAQSPSEARIEPTREDPCL